MAKGRVWGLDDRSWAMPLVGATTYNLGEVLDDEIWGISFPIRLGSLFLDRQGFSKIN